MQKHQECSAHSPSSTLKDLVMDSLRDTKGQSISVLDVSDRTCITDMMIIASGTSTRHLRSLADNLIKACRQDGIQPLGV
ncbi:MAG: RsfS/YbeB/iojap family protein, partial [Kistimonas sp.]|nr:RsfS/YbeB/iojap family protein [Kistimonas sp.]